MNVPSACISAVDICNSPVLKSANWARYVKPVFSKNAKTQQPFFRIIDFKQFNLERRAIVWRSLSRMLPDVITHQDLRVGSRTLDPINLF